jgi:hypothetical protein
VSYGSGAVAIAAVSGLCIHTFYHSRTTVAEPLPGDYWCYMPENGAWKPVSPNWQSGNGFAPG